MGRIPPDANYFTSVLPAVVVFGIGLTLVVAPVTATVLAAADSRHSGIASGINNAVSRVAGLLAVAVLPLAAGLTGDSFYDPAAMTSGFHTAMHLTAALSVLGGIIAWFTIDAEVLRRDEPPEPRGTDDRRVLLPRQRPRGLAEPRVDNSDGILRFASGPVGLRGVTARQGRLRAGGWDSRRARCGSCLLEQHDP